MMKRVLSIMLMLLFALSGSSSVKEEQKAAAFKQISQEEAKEMMTKNDGHVIVDVRCQDEYDSGHISDALYV